MQEQFKHYTHTYTHTRPHLSIHLSLTKANKRETTIDIPQIEQKAVRAQSAQKALATKHTTHS